MPYLAHSSVPWRRSTCHVSSLGPSISCPVFPVLHFQCPQSTTLALTASNHNSRREVQFSYNVKEASIISGSENCNGDTVDVLSCCRWVRYLHGNAMPLYRERCSGAGETESIFARVKHAAQSTASSVGAAGRGRVPCTHSKL